MIKFGPSGNCEAFYAAGYKHSEQSAKFVKDLGLDCFEYSFGKGVMLSEGKAISIGEAFKEQGVEISAHAPYFINFANPADEAAQKSYGYVMQSAKFIKIMGGERVVFHPAAQGKATREEAVRRTSDRLKVLCEYIYLNGFEDIKFCPETMGKLAQIGTLEEIVEFCKNPSHMASFAACMTSASRMEWIRDSASATIMPFSLIYMTLDMAVAMMGVKIT